MLANSGDIAIGGSQLKAGGDTTLTAANDILLTGAANTQQSTGSNSSGGVGISFGLGNGSAGLSIFASVNGAKGKDTGNGTRLSTMAPLQVWFSWMAKQGVILANPAADLELPRLEKRLTRTILSVKQVEEIRPEHASGHP